MGKKRKADSESTGVGSGSTISAKKSRGTKDPSGTIIPIDDKLRIEQEGTKSISSGLLTVENPRPVELKPDVPQLDLSVMLEDAWSLMDMDVSTKRFRKKLCAVVPSLSKQFVKNAWHSLMDEYELASEYRPGEMAFQQLICTPFAKLLMAAAGENGLANPSYRADEVVYSSLLIDRKANSESTIEKKKLAIRHDSAATLYQQWDAFAMMEINAPNQCKKECYLIDYDKCVLMTATTAVAVRKCIQQKDYGKVLLPFIISTGVHASLYVTGLDENGNPVVFMVRYPDGSTSAKHDLSYSPCDDRTKLFIAFAVLLNNFKKFFDASVNKVYMEQVKDRMEALEDVEEYAPTGWSTDQEPTDGNASRSD